MKCELLTAKRWQGILANSLSPEERKLVLDHLKRADCEACEEFLSTMDSATEHRFLRLFNSTVDYKSKTPSPGINENRPGDSGEVHKKNTSIPASVWQKISDAISAARPLSTAWVGGFAALALLMAGIMSQLYLGKDMEVIQTIKQDERARSMIAEINVRFAVGHYENGALVVNQGIDGGVYRDSEAIFLNYQIPAEGHVYFVGYQNDQSIELLFPEKDNIKAVQSAGEHTVGLDGKITGLPLHGISGKYFIIGIYSHNELSFFNNIVPIVQKLDIPPLTADGAPFINEIKDGIAVDVVYFNVQT